MATTLTLTDNSWRSKEFRTRTILEDESGRKVIKKVSITREAQKFLNNIVKRERANTEYLKEHFDVLCGNLKGNYIEYEYLPYQSLDQKIAFELRANRCDRADKLVDLYVQKISSLDKTYTCPTEFLKMISQDTFENYQFEADCLSQGLLDLTPRNILVDGSRWIVIDNEWSFDFPIPSVFIIFRAIREIVIEFQSEIRRCTERTRPSFGFIVRGLRTYYFPENWAKYITNNSVSIEQMFKWECGFRQYVAGSRGGSIGRIKTNPRTKTHFSAWYLRNDIAVIKGMSHFLKKHPITHMLVRFLKRILFP